MILDELELEFNNSPLSNLSAISYHSFCNKFPSITEFIDAYGYFLFDLTILDRIKLYMELLLLALIEYPTSAKEMAMDLEVIIEEVEVWGRYV